MLGKLLILLLGEIVVGDRSCFGEVAVGEVAVGEVAVEKKFRV